MAKSKILKDLANNSISLDVALKRLMIICNDLNYQELYNWADKELNGYDANEPIPEYRKQKRGQIKYSGLKGNMFACLELKNQPLPNQWIPKKIDDVLNERYDRDPISSIIEKSKSNNKYSFDLTDMAAFIDVGINFTSIYEISDSTYYSEIIYKLERILLKIFMKLDKEFGNLDELDIDTTSKEETQIASFEKTLVMEIGKMVVINVGDGNKIVKSNIGED